MRLRSFACFGVAALLAACGDNLDAPTCLPDCEGTRGYDAIAYALRARFDWDAQRLIASEDVTLAVQDGETVVVLDSEVDIARVHAGGKTLAFVADEETGTVSIDLAPLRPGARPVTFTIEYEAPVSDGLVVTTPRDGDPVHSRVVYTNSEPDRSPAWLVANDNPADRATWAVEVTVAATDDVIANGARAADRTVDGAKVVSYAFAQPLPTYLMAFAAGQLEHTERTGGRVPLSLWYRKGLAIDPARNLDAVADSMAHFEMLVGPYPFDSYAVVLLPEFPGGMENASITFNSERSGQGNVGVSLNAHELAHQWFGDLVTMRSYDDVWVKEGMATLLAAEAQRRARDGEGRGRLFGDEFSFIPDDAIVDRALTGIDKYTSGPYERAAWLMTQIRGRVGEQAFWATLREVLTTHAYDSIDGPTFVRSFAPELDEATIAAIIASLDKLDVPTIKVETAVVADGTQVTLTLTDRLGSLLAPIEITVVDGAGAATVSRLETRAPLIVVVPAGGYLAPDERDLHPDDAFVVGTDEDLEALAPLMLPTSPAALAAFATRSAAHQERALSALGAPVLEPAALVELHGQLDALPAREVVALGGCEQLRAAADPAPWLAALRPLVVEPAIQRFNTSYARCGTELPTQALLPELTRLVASSTPHDLARLEYLISFDYGPSESLALIARLAAESPSLAIRDLAIRRLWFHAAHEYSPIPDDQLPAWRTFFRARLPESTSENRLFAVWNAAVALRDLDALPVLAPLLRTVKLLPNDQRYFVCDAFDLAGSDQAAWGRFKTALGRSGMPREVLEVLDAPARCHPPTPPMP